MQTYILPSHAAQCLDIPIHRLSELRLPRAGYGVDADAVIKSPRYAQVMKHLEALARQAERRRLEASGRDRDFDAAAREAMLDRRAVRKADRKRTSEDILAKKRWRQRARRQRRPGADTGLTDW